MSKVHYDRVMSRVEWQGDCLVYTGARNVPGKYGYLFRSDGGPRLAHRIVMEYHYGPPPADKPLVLHSCDNMGCVNIEHLRFGTHADNNQDALDRGRQVPHYGEHNGNSKLSNADAEVIRTSSAHWRELSTRFGVSKATIVKIRNGSLRKTKE